MKRRYKDDRSRFLVVSESVTRGNRHTWQVGRLRLAIRKAFFTRCSREMVAIPGEFSRFGWIKALLA